MIPRSIAARITLTQQLTAVLVVAAFAGSALALTGRSLLNDETTMLRGAAVRAAAEFERELAEQPSIPAAARLLLAMEPPSHVQLTLLGPAGELLGSSQAVAASAPDPGGRDRSARRSGRRHEERYTSKSGVVVAASVDTAPREAVLTRLSLVMLWIGLPLMALVYFGAGAAARQAVKPLAELSRRVAAIPSGHPRQGIAPLQGLSEIDALTGAFNELLTRLDERLSSERRFTAEASHELRTPLTALSGEIELALADPGLHAAARQSLQLAAGQARQMQQLVEAMLLLRRMGDLSTAPDPGFEPVNLADVLREAIPGLLRVYPDRESDLRLDLPDEVMVFGQPALLSSAVGNLIENAVKFSTPGKAVHVDLSEVGGRARLVIDDQGPGIPEPERERIFEPFYRSREARANTTGFGLGLPILRRVVEAHGGAVAVAAAPGGGARFQIDLPLWSQGVVSSPAAPVSAGA